jgi:hypothetical protein
MKQLTTTLLASAALVAAASAGSAPSMSSGKGKGVMPPPPAPSCACEIAYNYVQLFYGHGEYDLDNVNANSDGLNAQVSYSPVEHFFLTAGGGYDWVETDAFGNYNDLTLHAGVGGWVPLAPCLHLGVEVGVSYNGTDGGDSDFGDGEFDYYAKPHLRACFGPMEAKVGVEFTSADVEQQWMVQTEVIAKVLGPADLAVGIDFNSDVQFYNAGIRLRF